MEKGTIHNINLINSPGRSQAQVLSRAIIIDRLFPSPCLTRLHSALSYSLEKNAQLIALCTIVSQHPFLCASEPAKKLQAGREVEGHWGQALAKNNEGATNRLAHS